MADNDSVHSHSSRASSIDPEADLPDEREIEYRESLTRHPSTILEKEPTASSSVSGLERHNTVRNVISAVRSRGPGQTANFSHPLAHTKTAEDVIVGFDGPDDPYMPLNWSFYKKATTTLLYGLTTMGMLVRTL